MQTYQEYRKWVTSTAECVIDRLRDYPETDPSDALWETCDGQVVYYTDGASVMEHTDNPDAISDVGVGDLSGESWVGIRQRFAVWAFQYDVSDAFWPMLETLRADWATARAAYDEAHDNGDPFVDIELSTGEARVYTEYDEDTPGAVDGDVRGVADFNVADEPTWLD